MSGMTANDAAHPEDWRVARDLDDAQWDPPYDATDPADWPTWWNDPEAMEAMRDAAEVRQTERGSR